MSEQLQAVVASRYAVIHTRLSLGEDPAAWASQRADGSWRVQWGVKGDPEEATVRCTASGARSLADAFEAERYCPGLPQLLRIAADMCDADGGVRAPNAADRNHHHGRHPWAQPGDEPDRVFILRFSDPDMREQVFLGEDAEADAHAAYRLYAPTWNVYLLATLPAAEIRDA